MLWGITHFTHQANRIQAPLQGQFLKSLFEVYSDPWKALLIVSFLFFPYQLVGLLSVLDLQRLYESPPNCLLCKVLLFLEAPFGLNIILCCKWSWFFPGEILNCFMACFSSQAKSLSHSSGAERRHNRALLSKWHPSLRTEPSVNVGVMALGVLG